MFWRWHTGRGFPWGVGAPHQTELGSHLPCRPLMLDGGMRVVVVAAG